MTLDEIAYNIINLVRGGRPNQSEHVSLDQIKFNVKYYRAMMIRRDFARNGIVTRHIEQDLGCLELEEVNPSKCCNLPTACSVSRTIKKVPRTVRFNFKEGLTYVGDITGIETIPVIDNHMVKWLPHDKYTSHKYKGYMIEDYLYIYNAKGLKFVNVRGVFESPEDLKNFQCENGVCWDDSKDFPIPADMVQSITMGMASGELRLLTNTLSDTLADQEQDVKGGTPAPTKAKE
tara:strand:- start:1248 stop:1946 length:699 start_codon:yes stop_codon:yes gene_type:complete